jgi:hypothetical protein
MFLEAVVNALLEEQEARILKKVDDFFTKHGIITAKDITNFIDCADGYAWLAERYAEKAGASLN